jgi:hypothetical protein
MWRGVGQSPPPNLEMPVASSRSGQRLTTRSCRERFRRGARATTPPSMCLTRNRRDRMLARLEEMDVGGDGERDFRGPRNLVARPGSELRPPGTNSRRTQVVSVSPNGLRVQRRHPAGLLSGGTAGRRQTRGRWRDHPGGVRCNEGLADTSTPTAGDLGLGLPAAWACHCEFDALAV